MSFAGMVLDFNGVLWWDTRLQEESWSEFAAAVRGRPFSPDEMAVHVHGRINRDTMEYLMGRTVQGAELAGLVRQKEAVYRQLCLDQGPGFKLSPGAVELLDWLAARGVPRTIATASDRINVDFFAEHLALGRWFDVGRIVCDDGTRPGKPAPDIYREAAARLGLAPARCVVVEDSLAGLQAARAAGMGHVVALGPADRHAELRRVPGAHRVIATLGELPAERLFEGV